MIAYRVACGLGSGYEAVPASNPSYLAEYYAVTAFFQQLPGKQGYLVRPGETYEWKVVDLWIRAFSDLTLAWSGRIRQLKLPCLRPVVFRPNDRHHAVNDGLYWRPGCTKETGAGTWILCLHSGNREGQM